MPPSSPLEHQAYAKACVDLNPELEFSEIAKKTNERFNTTYTRSWASKLLRGVTCQVPKKTITKKSPKKLTKPRLTEPEEDKALLDLLKKSNKEEKEVEVNTAFLARRWKTKKKLSLLEKQKVVNRRLQEAGMVWNPAVPGLVLKPDHIREAKDFAEAYQDVKAITWEKQALFVDLKLWTPRLSESLVVLF